jgi:hypothetical protein
MSDNVTLATICVIQEDTVPLYSSAVSNAGLIPLCTNILAHKMWHSIPFPLEDEHIIVFRIGTNTLHSDPHPTTSYSITEIYFINSVATLFQWTSSKTSTFYQQDPNNSSKSEALCNISKILVFMVRGYTPISTPKLQYRPLSANSTRSFFTGAASPPSATRRRRILCCKRTHLS